MSAQIATLVERAGPDGQLLRTPANDSALLTLEFKNGRCGTIVVSAIAHLAERRQHLQFCSLLGVEFWG